MVKKKFAVCVLFGLLVSAAIEVAFMVWRRNRAVGVAERVVDAGADEVRQTSGVHVSKRTVSRRKSSSRRRMDRGDGNRPAVEKVPESEDDDDMSPADRRLMEAIEQGQSDEDLEQLVKIIPEVSASTNAEVRSEFVDALGWFGVQGMNHLLPFMADSDEDVRESAIENWTSALSEVEDEGMRAQMIGAVMQVLKDEDALESMTNELIDMDEKIALQTLIDVIEGGKAAQQGVAVAREQYEFLTGEEYTTVEAANQWLAENYEPPEPADGADSKGRKQ